MVGHPHHRPVRRRCTLRALATRRARSAESRRARRRFAVAPHVPGRRGPRRRLRRAPAGTRPGSRRHPGHATAEHRGVSRAVPRRAATGHHRQPGADAVPAPRTGADRRPDGRARDADGARAERSRLRNERRGTGQEAAAPGLVPRSGRAGGQPPLRAGAADDRIARRARRARRRVAGLGRRRRDDLLDVGNGGPAQGRAAHSQPLDRDQLRSPAWRRHPPRRTAAEPVPADQHGGDRRLLHELAAQRGHARAAPSARPRRLPATDRRRKAGVRDRTARRAQHAAQGREAARQRRPLVPALHRFGLGAARPRDDPWLPGALRHRDRQRLRLERRHVADEQCRRTPRTPNIARACSRATGATKSAGNRRHTPTSARASSNRRRARRSSKRASPASCRSRDRRCSTAISARRRSPRSRSRRTAGSAPATCSRSRATTIRRGSTGSSAGSSRSSSAAA